MPKITPMLWFDGQAEEAANFYISVFKHSKIIRKTLYGEGAPKRQGSVALVDFELDGQPFTAINGGPEFKFTEAISLVVHCKNQDEVDDYWKKLTAGGGQEVECGWLKDKYGLSWQITPEILFDMIADRDRQKADRAFQAMMKMKKIDIQALKKAYEQRAA